MAILLLTSVGLPMLCAATYGVQDRAAPTPILAPTQSGQDLFASAGCSHCHMIDGIGGNKGPNLSGVGRRWKSDSIRKQIEEGSMEMPEYKDVLSEADLEALVTYLRARKAAAPKGVGAQTK